MASIPESLLNDLKRIPRDCPVALLMRHSARHPIVDPAQPYVAMLTEEGVRLAEELGGLLGKSFSPGRLLAAPVTRCQDTAAAIARGAGWPVDLRIEDCLSHPFIAPAWELVERGQVNGTLPVEVRTTMNLLLGNTGRPPGLDVAVTHDTIVGAVVGALLKAPVTGDFWPDILEGMFTWRDEKEVHVLWRGEERRLSKDYR